VVPTKQTGSPFGILQMEFGTSHDDGFKIKGVLTGKYLKVKRKRFTGTGSELEATQFIEIIESNNYNSYRPIDRPECRLSVTKNGKYRLNCAKQTSRRASFLPRKTHLKHIGNLL